MNLPTFRRLGLPASRETASHGDVMFWVSLAAAVAIIKIILLLFDHFPLFFLGDSGVYLWSAIEPPVPLERSFTYGLFFIRPILAVLGSVEAVVVLQALVSGVTCLLGGICMRVGFNAPSWVVALIVTAYALEPLALIHERLILAETLGLFCLALFVLVGLLYIRQPRWHYILLLTILGTVALSLRTSLIPVVAIATVAAPLLGARRLWEEMPDRKGFWRVLILHLVLAIGGTAGFHEAYKQYFSYMTGFPPAYNAGGNFFLIASWAPLVSKVDFPNEEAADRVLPNVKHDLKDRHARPVNRFWRDGLVEVIKDAENGNYYLAQKLAGKVARNAGLRDPLGVARLAWGTYTDFWNTTMMRPRVALEQGSLELPESMLKYFKEHYDEDLSGRHLQSTLTKQWHNSTVAWYWYRFLLLSPLLTLFTIVIAGSNRASSIFIGVVSCAIVAVAVALVTEPSLRYLHPVAWLTFLQIGQILCVAPGLSRRPALGTAAN